MAEWHSGSRTGNAEKFGEQSRHPNTPGWKATHANTRSALVDCRYEIQNPDSTSRKMWSSFIVVIEEKSWKIAAIRNMLPSARWIRNFKSNFYQKNCKSYYGILKLFGFLLKNHFCLRPSLDLGQLSQYSLFRCLKIRSSYAFRWIKTYVPNLNAQ